MFRRYESCLVWLYCFVCFIDANNSNSQCTTDGCLSDDQGVGSLPLENRYTEAANRPRSRFEIEIERALETFVPCKRENCSCHLSVLRNDLKPFKSTGISKSMFESARDRGTKYQIISHKLYRQENCHFPSRCSGIEYFLLQLIDKISDTEMIINTRDWPQLNRKWNGQLAPVFSFSKTADYWDIMYPAWSFWEGGPAISLYPTGLGRWDNHRKSLSDAAKKWPWNDKKSIAFFRGSRTSNERDPIVLLSRARPDLVDAQYTKNQAWKSDADTLYSPPAAEVSLEDHCQFKYLFNYRGVAASFRFKHLFLCESLVFHVGDEWLEFFYPSLKPWIHYVPVSQTASQKDIEEMLEFFKGNDGVASEIAERGYRHIWDNLRISDVKCYWRRLLKDYSKLLKYDVARDSNLIEIKQKTIKI